MPSGSAALRARRSASGSRAERTAKLTTWQIAWTPASVRAATASVARMPAAASASSRAACTVGSPGCRWNPRNRPPSYTTSTA